MPPGGQEQQCNSCLEAHDSDSLSAQTRTSYKWENARGADTARPVHTVAVPSCITRGMARWCGTPRWSPGSWCPRPSPARARARRRGRAREQPHGPSGHRFLRDRGADLVRFTTPPPAAPASGAEGATVAADRGGRRSVGTSLEPSARPPAGLMRRIWEEQERGGRHAPRRN